MAFDSTDLDAQAIAFDAKGTLYVATSPDGKVYRVSASGEKSVFFDPKTKYIWDLAFAPDGTLYVATGDKGQVFAVAPEGKGELFYSSDEAHISVLAFDAKGNLSPERNPAAAFSASLAEFATKSSSKRLCPAKAEGFVLYETSKREVTALAVAPDGSIYVAAIGEKQRPSAQAHNDPLPRRKERTTSPTGGVIGRRLSTADAFHSLSRRCSPAASTASRRWRARRTLDLPR